MQELIVIKWQVSAYWCVNFFPECFDMQAEKVEFVSDLPNHPTYCLLQKVVVLNGKKGMGKMICHAWIIEFASISHEANFFYDNFFEEIFGYEKYLEGKLQSTFDYIISKKSWGFNKFPILTTLVWIFS